MALPIDNGRVTLVRYAALAAALGSQFPGRFAQLDCGPQLGVVALWLTPPSTVEQAAFDATVNAWVWTEQPDEALERLVGQNRLLAACVLRASTAWAGASAAQKTRIQAIIDAGAAKVIAALQASGSALPEGLAEGKPKRKRAPLKKKEKE